MLLLRRGFIEFGAAGTSGAGLCPSAVPGPPPLHHCLQIVLVVMPPGTTLAETKAVAKQVTLCLCPCCMACGIGSPVGAAHSPARPRPGQPVAAPSAPAPARHGAHSNPMPQVLFEVAEITVDSSVVLGLPPPPPAATPSPSVRCVDAACGRGAHSSHLLSCTAIHRMSNTPPSLLPCSPPPSARPSPPPAGGPETSITCTTCPPGYTTSASGATSPADCNGG
jgi:hypothetical protein